MTETIELILSEIRARKYPEAKRLLDELSIELEKLEKLQKFFDDIKSVVRNTGKSNVISKSEIDEVINEYERKN